MGRAGQKRPVVAAMFAILLLAFAGIPLTAGFIGKFAVFRAAYHERRTAGRDRGALRGVAAFFYLRVIVLMFFADPPEDGPTVAIPGLDDYGRR